MDQTVKHTPGPLMARRINDTDRPYAVINPNGPHGDEMVAGYLRKRDAELYAAAPELLDCLKEFVAAAERTGIHVHHDALRNRYERAVAAIARAEGRS